MSASSCGAKTLSIIGCGKLGQTLGRLWTEQRVFRIQQVLNRSSESAQQATDFIGAGKAVASFSDMQSADVYLIGTPDGQIAEAAGRLAASASLEAGTIVFHCSGALPSTLLQPLKDKGAFIASVHPIKSFSSAQAATASFGGTWCGIEGDPQALEVLRPAFEAIGAKMAEIRTEEKLIYHAAAVFASNYLVTLLDVALQAYAKAGIPESVARELLAPLVSGTLDNVVRSGTERALTGPIARGDIGTVVRQYRAVSAWDKRYGKLYREMGKLTGMLAARRKKEA
jgi:predicted short-subunit dehydrogenase-like oxidoreductase (DUF2520 family)